LQSLVLPSASLTYLTLAAMQRNYISSHEKAIARKTGRSPSVHPSRMGILFISAWMVQVRDEVPQAKAKISCFSSRPNQNILDAMRSEADQNRHHSQMLVFSRGHHFAYFKRNHRAQSRYIQELTLSQDVIIQRSFALKYYTLDF